MISIHAPLRGERQRDTRSTMWHSYFNPRSPTRGATKQLPMPSEFARDFNPRSPTRGATGRTCSGSFHLLYFNPRSPTRGATTSGGFDYEFDYISIHAPLRGERRMRSTRRPRPANFNPRSPTRGATTLGPDEVEKCEFQSTLPYAGSDDRDRGNISKHSDFNPRSPTRGATRNQRESNGIREFQSTLPYAGSDADAGAEPQIQRISIHAPLRGERRKPLSDGIGRMKFQSTLPYAGSDGGEQGAQSVQENFNPRSPTRGATALRDKLAETIQFQSTIEVVITDHHEVGELKPVGVPFSAPLCWRRRCLSVNAVTLYFNPRSPTRGATRQSVLCGY